MLSAEGGVGVGVGSGWEWMDGGRGWGMGTCIPPLADTELLAAKHSVPAHGSSAIPGLFSVAVITDSRPHGAFDLGNYELAFNCLVDR